MKTLYRAYRPQNFEEIVNQNHIKITLQHEIETNRMTHAYLFCGPRGIGKTTIARIFAKSLNCQKRKSNEYEPCNKCDMCKDLMAGRSLDMIEIDAASHTGVDNVRESIISAARVAPSKGKYKIFIIDEVHMLSISAFNALLKLLEEPPVNTIFILCTTELHKIPDTIISRTERFDFKRISANDIVKKLQYIISKEKIEIEDGVLENIAQQSNGHMRDAESLLGQVVAIGGKKVSKEEADLVIPRSDLNEVINLLEFLSKKDAGSAIGLLNRLLDDGISLKRFLTELIELLRKIMLSKINHRLGEKFGLELGEGMEIRTTKVGASLKIDNIITIIERLLLVQNEMKNAFIEQLPFEIAIAELCLDNVKNMNFSFNQNSSPSFKKHNANPVDTNDDFFSHQPHQTKTTQAESPLSKSEAKQVKIKNINLNKDDINAKWNKVLAKVKTHNHSLSFILRACQPRDFDNNQLCLAFKYKFHKDRIAEINIKQIVENVLQEVYGQNITIKTIVDETMKVESLQANMNENVKQAAENINNLPESENNNRNESVDDSVSIKNQDLDQGKNISNNTDEEMLNNVLKTFGGKVV